MGRIWVREFTGGLDARRMPATTPGGVLTKGENGHINSGGDFEKRAAFVKAFTLPAGKSKSLKSGAKGLVVFGHEAPPAMPAGVAYQRTLHPSAPATALVRIQSADLYGGKLYAVGQFADGSVHHYYDEANVTDWFDGRARASFRVTGGGVTPAVKAIGSFDVTAGTLGGGNQITSVKIDGVDALTGPIAHTGDNGTTASAIASAINSLTSSPDYTADATGATVTISASLAGAAPNGKAISVVVGGTAAVGSIINMAGGADAVAARLANLQVNGVDVIAAPVDWATSHEATAAAIASAINAHASTPEYDATAVGDTVNIIADASGDASNGYVVTPTVANGFVTTPASTALAGGVTSDAFVPGSFVKTIGSKVYAVSDGALHFSGIRQPTKWTTDAVGAGFIDMSKETSSAEELVAVANYQNFVAVFAGTVVLIYYVDPDPNLNAKSQILRNTGTNYPGSVTEFGDSDLFYLAESGCRSLKARDSSNAAATTDIGVPVDALIRAKLRTLTDAERQNIQGLINPDDGRFWLIIKDQIFVFSFFPNSKVSAWTTYNAETVVGGVVTPFNIEGAATFGGKVYVRSGDEVYAFGGAGTDLEYDKSVAKGHLPFLAADKPTEFKSWEGFDCAAEGQWAVWIEQLGTAGHREQVATLAEATYPTARHAIVADTTHISLQFETSGETAAKIGSATLHYVGGDDG